MPLFDFEAVFWKVNESNLKIANDIIFIHFIGPAGPGPGPGPGAGPYRPLGPAGYPPQGYGSYPGQQGPPVPQVAIIASLPKKHVF